MKLRDSVVPAGPWTAVVRTRLGWETRFNWGWGIKGLKWSLTHRGAQRKADRWLASRGLVPGKDR